MKKVIVLGGGFGGVAAVLELAKRLSKDEAEITLIDRNQFHTFTPSLYEVVTEEEPQKNIAIPFSEIFPKKVQLVTAGITQVNPQTMEVTLQGGQKLQADYLLLAVGSESAYFNVPGLAENSIPLKSVADAMRIQTKIEQIAQAKLLQKQVMRIIVGGGGFSGVELAAELQHVREMLSKKYKTPKDLIEISVIEGMNRLLNGLEESVSIDAKKRLEKEGIIVHLGSNIANLTATTVQTADGSTHAFDLFIWTGGVKASSLLAQSGFAVNKRGQVSVEQNLLVKGSPNIFAIGDIAEFTDPKTTKFAPGVAQVACDQGKVAGENIANSIKSKPLKNYILKHYGYVIPLKGKYAIAPLKWLTLKGFPAWVLQQLVFFKYLLDIMPIHKSMMRWNQFEQDLHN